MSSSLLMIWNFHKGPFWGGGAPNTADDAAIEPPKMRFRWLMLGGVRGLR